MRSMRRCIKAKNQHGAALVLSVGNQILKILSPNVSSKYDQKHDVSLRCDVSSIFACNAIKKDPLEARPPPDQKYIKYWVKIPNEQGPA